MSWEEQVQLFLFTNISRGRSFQHRSPRKGGSVFPHSTGRGGAGGGGRGGRGRNGAGREESQGRSCSFTKRSQNEHQRQVTKVSVFGLGGQGL